MAADGLSPQPAAIVLVGGRSSRMGTDKASLVVDGVAMRDRVLQVVAAAGITTTVVAGTESVPDAVAVPDADDVSDVGRAQGPQGPLAGVVGAWRALQTTRPSGPNSEAGVGPVIVLACDLPWLVPGILSELIAASAEHTHGAVAHDGERPQPLVAAYHPLALDEMAERYNAGERSLRRCSANWDLGIVNATPELVADADTPSDLAGFRVEWPV